MIGPNAIIQNQINNYLDTHGIHDDFEYYYDTLFQDDSSHIVTHEVIPIEYDVYNKALNIDELLEGLDYEFLTEDFLLKNVQRFTLPPFLAKFNCDHIKQFIILNVYDVYVITIKILF